LADITASAMDANHGTGAALHIGTEKRFNDKNLSPFQDALYTTKRSLREIQKGYRL
jgi:hypothetical protein